MGRPVGDVALWRSADELIKLMTECKHLGLRSFKDQTCEFYFERDQRRE